MTLGQTLSSSSCEHCEMKQMQWAAGKASGSALLSTFEVWLPLALATSSSGMRSGLESWGQSHGRNILQWFILKPKVS